MALRKRTKAFIAIGGTLALFGAGTAQTALAAPSNDQRTHQRAAQTTAAELREVDVEVASQGFPFSLTRYYHWDPQASSSLLGKGWRLSLEARLLPSSSTVTLDDADGTNIVFTQQADGSYSAPAGTPYALTTAGTGYSLTAQDGSTRAFDATGRLTGIKNSAGLGLRISYSAAGRITAVTDAEGRRALFSTDSTGRLASVTLADGRRVTYVYTSQSYLSAVAGVDGTVRTYTYDAQGHLIT
ncbi:DUF6531 domain-containing protein [Streptomyces sp. NPDC060011]|uniref:DUF6531 domain-containing protein n=1 Tax=Streptomyces sp. NPDC060011 TaxID=3347037 RepID=UPI003695EA76